jgi:hypothetical protein
MPRAKKAAKKIVIKYWSPADLKRLRALAGRTPLARIARQLRRTEMAVRWKATQTGISLAKKK